MGEAIHSKKFIHWNSINRFLLAWENVGFRKLTPVQHVSAEVGWMLYRGQVVSFLSGEVTADITADIHHS